MNSVAGMKDRHLIGLYQNGFINGIPMASLDHEVPCLFLEFSWKKCLTEIINGNESKNLELAVMMLMIKQKLNHYLKISKL